jgi:hypothetical protein
MVVLQVRWYYNAGDKVLDEDIAFKAAMHKLDKPAACVSQIGTAATTKPGRQNDAQGKTVPLGCRCVLLDAMCGLCV